MKVISFNFFVAGSKKLSKERDMFKAVALELQCYYRQLRGIRCELDMVTFESFNYIAGDDAKQEEYNRHIREVADVVFFVFDGDVGGITKSEFEVAANSYTQNKKPKIGVFTKLGATNNHEIEDLKNCVDTLNQYWCEYKDDEDLKQKIKAEISLYIDTALKPTPAPKKIIYTLIGVAALILAILGMTKAWTIPESSKDDTPQGEAVPYSINYTDNLATQGYLIVKPSTSDKIIKYHFADNEQTDINWEQVNTQIIACDTLYPKRDGLLYLYATSDQNQECVCSFSFSYTQFIDTAIRTQDSPTLAKMFDNILPLAVHCPGNVVDILRFNPIQGLYDYLTNYGYRISAVESAASSNNILSDQYERITSVKLTK